MRTLLLCVGAALLAPTIAAACPTVAAGAMAITLSQADLAAPYTVNTTGGGSIALTGCGYTSGFATPTPQISITFTDTRRPVQLSTSASCDPILLVNAPDGSWRYNDDNGASYDSLVSVDVVPGRMDVWIGTHDGQPCAIELTVR